jgi:hypothetical protein
LVRRRKYLKEGWILDIFALFNSNRWLEIRKLFELKIAIGKR